MNNRKKKVSLQTIADRLGVSKYAVSLALNNRPGVSAALRSKVQQTAQELGYQKPSRAASSGRMSILFLIPEYIRNDTSFFGDIYWSIENKIRESGHNPILCCVTKAQETGLILPEYFKGGAVSGVITIGVFAPAYIRLLQSQEIPLVSVDQHYDSIAIDSVETANGEGAYQVVKYLIECGHRDIGFIGPVNIASSLYSRWCGYCKAMADARLDINMDYCIVSDTPMERQYQTPAELNLFLDGLERLPTAWFCANDGSAVILVNTLKERGLNVPEDVSVAGFDNQKVSELLVPALTTYNVHRDEMGRQAVQSLLEQLASPTAIRRRVSILGEVIVRDSVKKLV